MHNQSIGSKPKTRLCPTHETRPLDYASRKGHESQDEIRDQRPEGPVSTKGQDPDTRSLPTTEIKASSHDQKLRPWRLVWLFGVSTGGWVRETSLMIMLCTNVLTNGGILWCLITWSCVYLHEWEDLTQNNSSLGLTCTHLHHNTCDRLMTGQSPHLRRQIGRSRPSLDTP